MPDRIGEDPDGQEPPRLIDGKTERKRGRHASGQIGTDQTSSGPCKMSNLACLNGVKVAENVNYA